MDGASALNRFRFIILPGIKPDEARRLLAELESGALPLDQLLGSYQRGAELLAFCRDRLQAVEAQVKVLEDGRKVRVFKSSGEQVEA